MPIWWYLYAKASSERMVCHCEWQINRDCHQHAFSPFRVETFTFHGKNFSRAWVFYSVLIFFFFFLFFAHERTPVIAHHFHRCIHCVGNTRPWPPIEYHNFENRSRVSPSGSVSFIPIFIRQSYRMISLLRFRKTFGRFPAEGVSAKIESLFIAPLILSIFGLFSYSIMWGTDDTATVEKAAYCFTSETMMKK